MAIELKNGDIVHVRLKVDDSHPNHGADVWCIQGDSAPTLMQRNDIIHVEPRPLQVGDEVYVHGGSMKFVVRAVFDDFAWVQASEGYLYTLRTANLQRVAG